MLHRSKCLRALLIILVAPLVPLLKAKDAGYKIGEWSEIPHEELAATTPKVDPDAHSEFTFRGIEIDDHELFESTIQYHNRVKLFTEAAVQEWIKVDIEYTKGSRVKNIKARVIYPDQSIVDLDNGEIVTRKIFNYDSYSGYVKSFTFPGLIPGCIIEYAWEKTTFSWFQGATLDLLDKRPTWEYDIKFKPYTGLAYGLISYNSESTLEKTKDGYQALLKDLPARSHAPFTGARRDFEPFIVINYSSKLSALTEEKYWNYRAGKLHKSNEELFDIMSAKLKKKAQELTQNRESDEDKILAVYNYCSDEIVNISEFTTAYTEDEIEKLKRNESPHDTLKNGYGTAYDINTLFAALLDKGGFTVSLAEIEDKSSCTYLKEKIGRFNLSDLVVAVKVNGKWSFYDPGSSYLPCGVLNPENSGATTLIIDGEIFNNQKTPNVSSDFNKQSRIANLIVNEYGDLNGSIAIKYEGFEAIELKRAFSGLTTKEQEELILEKYWKPRLPRIEIDNFKVKNENVRTTDLVVQFTFEIPGYADIAGDRLIMNPSIFQVGSKPVFQDEERTVSAAFPYLYSIADHVNFFVPNGYSYESSAGTTIKFNGNVLTRMSMTSKKEYSEFVYQRFFALKEPVIVAPYYSLLKGEFDAANDADHRPLIFMKSESNTSAKAGAN